MLERVYVIGAGASKAETKHINPSLPLAKEFFTSRYLNDYWPRFQLDVRKIPPFPHSATAKVMEQYFGDDSELAGFGYDVDLEEVYSFLASSVHKFRPKIYHHDPFELARREVLAYVYDVIRSVSLAPQKMRLYTAIASQLTPGDSVITFNWDLLIDKALERSDVGNEPIGRQDMIRDPRSHYGDLRLSANPCAHGLQGEHFLKLHGSINFMTCTNQRCEHQSYPYALSPKEVEEDAPELRYCLLCGSPLEVGIVPPQGSKSYGMNRFVSLQAAIAAEKIHDASEIVVIGYSFSHLDFEASALMRSARGRLGSVEDITFNLERLVVVDPSVRHESYRNKVQRLFGLPVVC